MAPKPNPSIADQYSQYVVRPETPDDCWGWTGTTVGGYGRIQSAGEYAWAHHYSYTTRIGPIPEGMRVLHHCDNPPCTNPKHLYAGTAADNARDREARGRSNRTPRRGTEQKAAKLTDDEVRSILGRYRAGGVTQKVLAAEYGVHQSIVSEIISGKRWLHVSGGA